MEEKDDLEFDILTLVDDDGQEHEFELVDSIELGDLEYVALIPVFDDGEDLLSDNGELVIMRVDQQDGEDVLDAIEDDEEYQRVSELFVSRLKDEFDFLEDED